jgi:hypothetical protein
MEGKTHLFCTGMFAFALLFATFKLGYVSFYQSMLFFLAALEGVLLPDVDSPNSLGTKIKLAGILKWTAYFAKTIAYITKFFLYLFLKLVLWLFKKRGAEHRGVMHSFKGLVLVGAFWLAIGYLVLLQFNSLKYFPDLVLIVLGLLFGFLLHLWQDALTIGGVKLTDSVHIRGNLKTGKNEWAPQLFFLLFCAFSAHISNALSPLYGVAILILALPASFLLFVSRN